MAIESFHPVYSRKLTLEIHLLAFNISIETNRTGGKKQCDKLRD